MFFSLIFARDAPQTLSKQASFMKMGHQLNIEALVD